MALLKLPKDVQSLFCSLQICSYKKAVAELIYNSLDAGATSIAIRVNIQNDSIQVIDNGHGITKNDFYLLGQKHATSKCVNLASLKSAPNKYGFRGLALAGIVEVSKNVTITSRRHNSDETWVKYFHKGKEQKLCETSERPSKGTTKLSNEITYRFHPVQQLIHTLPQVDIKGFLYNLKIQKKVSDSQDEVNDIKNFLEQISLVHNNISISLRDDAKNDIIFKLHKNRDIYQTFSSVFDIQRKDIQELKVEKGEYKVTAYIGKRDNDASQKRWVYLNGQLLLNSKLNKILNDDLIKSLKLHLQRKTKVKSKNHFDFEEDLSKSGIPFYFMFITCPYYDYDIVFSSKQTSIEFKNWEQITKLLEKLSKLYAGEIENKTQVLVIKNQKNYNGQNTRNEVKKIIEKILGSNQKKTGIFQMAKGIKGKISKRKPKNQFTKLSLTKVISNNKKQKDTLKLNHDNLKKPENKCGGVQPCEVETSNHLKQKQSQKKQRKKIIMQKANKNIVSRKLDPKIKEIPQKHKTLLKKETDIVDKSIPVNTLKVINKIKPKKSKHQLHRKNKPNEQTDYHTKLRKLKEICKNPSKIDTNFNDIVKKFNEPTGSVKKRCNDIANKVEHIIASKKKSKRQIYVNESIQYSTVFQNNRNYSIQKKVEEVVIHDYIPYPIGLSQTTFDRTNVTDVDHLQAKMSSYDLIKTVLKTQEVKNTCTEDPNINYNVSVGNQINNLSPKESQEYTYPATLVKLTYESHNYEQYLNRVSHDYKFRKSEDLSKYSCDTKVMNKVRYITTNSRENFLVPIQKDVNQRRKSYLTKFEENSTEDSSYTIECMKSNEHVLNTRAVNRDINLWVYSPWNQTKNITYTIGPKDCIINNDNSKIGCTYTIIDETQNNDEILSGNDYDKNRYQCYNFDKSNDILNHNNEESNYNEEQINATNVIRDRPIFVSTSKESNSHIHSLNKNISPIEVCDTILREEHEHEKTENEFRINDSLFREDLEIDSFLCDRNAYTQRNFQDLMDLQDSEKEDPMEDIKSLIDGNVDYLVEKNDYDKTEKLCPNPEHEDQILNQLIYNSPNTNDKGVAKFHFSSRLRFVPKGMSQIFQNCRTKSTCDNTLDKEYYEEKIYNKFADDVWTNAKIFEPEVQNVKQIATKAIEKVGNRLNKDHASLVFSGDDLKHAKVLGQIDNKFIAVKLQRRAHQSHEVSGYLILFDQHAVHERIRLENNLSEYLKDEQWKSATLDDIIIKLTKDEIIYLHNFKDKFSQLGLAWTVTSTNEVAVNAIPEAILGKNPRQVEIIMKAVKNLISEEINTIKTQSGCISLYPKAIMELVFSEACRYAIKFGDNLSINDCVDLLNLLSECKTPFQCAHGRPVMAVLMEIQNENKKYEVNMLNVRKWVQNKRK